MTELESVIGTTFQPKECLVLMDSIGTDVRHVYKADIIARKGNKIDDIRKYVERIEIEQYKSAIIIIGTNELTDKSVWFRYCKHRHEPNFRLGPHPTANISTLKLKYIKLIDAIKYKNPTIAIELSPILPRLFDYEVNLSFMKDVNNMIRDLSSSYNFHHDRTLIKAFLKGGKPDPELYYIDGLHLSQKGSNKLSQILRCKVAKLSQRVATAASS